MKQLDSGFVEFLTRQGACDETVAEASKRALAWYLTRAIKKARLNFQKWQRGWRPPRIRSITSSAPRIIRLRSAKFGGRWVDGAPGTGVIARSVVLAGAICALTPPATALPAYVHSCDGGATCTAGVATGYPNVGLVEVDAHEIDQLYGILAREARCSVICGQTVGIEQSETRYNRMVVLLRLLGRDISEAIVGQSAAWDRPRQEHDLLLRVLRSVAKIEHRGL